MEAALTELGTEQNGEEENLEWKRLAENE